MPSIIVQLTDAGLQEADGRTAFHNAQEGTSLTTEDWLSLEVAKILCAPGIESAEVNIRAQIQAEFTTAMEAVKAQAVEAMTPVKVVKKIIPQVPEGFGGKV